MSMTKSTESTDDSTEHIPLDDAGDVTLPLVDVLRGRGAVFGKAGSGKSNTVSVVLEELLSRGHAAVVVDTDGEYWGLKEDYEVLHVGADEECDLRVGPEHGGKLAELALEQNVPIILDVSGFIDADERDAIVFETARALFDREKDAQTPLPLVVEEIHEYVPQQGGMGDVGEMLVRVAKRGRKRGLGIIGVSQRPADVAKDLITQCQWLMWHRLTWENDTSVVRRVVGNDYADEVQDLGDGEGFLMADWLDAITRVQVRRKATYDAGAAPGLDDAERPDLMAVSDDLVGELEEISEQQSRRQDRIAELEVELEQREERIEELEARLENQDDIAQAASQMADALSNADNGGGDAAEPVSEVIEERNELQSELAAAEDRIDDLEAELADLREELSQRPDISERALEAVDVLAEEFDIADGDSSKWQQKYQQAQERIAALEDDLEAAREDSGLPPEFEDALSFLKHEAVQEAVARANGKVTTDEGHTWDILFYLADDDVDSVHPDEATAVVDLHASNIRKILNALEEKEVVETVDAGRRKKYRLNVEGLERIVENHRKRQEMAEFREEL
jgi:predicted transcriptional regulator/peptidoglycan hydrolase CwlO-like protein